MAGFFPPGHSGGHAYQRLTICKKVFPQSGRERATFSELVGIPEDVDGSPTGTSPGSAPAVVTLSLPHNECKIGDPFQTPGEA